MPTAVPTHRHDEFHRGVVPMEQLGAIVAYAELNSSPASDGTPGVQTEIDFDTFYDVTLAVIGSLPTTIGLSYAAGVFTAEEDGVWLLNLGIEIVEAPGDTGYLVLTQSGQGYSPLFSIAASGNPSPWQVERHVAMTVGDTFSLIQASSGTAVVQIDGYAVLDIVRIAGAVA